MNKKTFLFISFFVSFNCFATENSPNYSKDFRQVLTESNLKNPAALAKEIQKLPEKMNVYNIQKEQKKNQKREGSGTRGGGSGVFNSMTGKVEVLDIYRSVNRDESSAFNNIDEMFIQMSSSSTNASDSKAQVSQKILEEVFRRVEHLDSNFHQALKTASMDLAFSRWTATTLPLSIVDDFVGQVQLVENEKQVQLAVRRADRVIYDRELYGAMDALNQAGLQLHEFIYGLSGHDNSGATQRMVSFLLSKELIGQHAKRDLSRLLFSLGLASLAKEGSFSLSPGFHFNQKKLSSDDICGPIENLSFNSNTGELSVKFAFSSKYPHLNQSDFVYTGKNSYEKAVSKMAALDRTFSFVISRTDGTSVFKNLALAKLRLGISYPAYMFPGKNIPADFICINRKIGTISNFQVMVTLDTIQNEYELELAHAEAEATAQQTKYFETKSSEDLNLKQKRDADLINLRFRHVNQLLRTDAKASWENNKVLEQLTLSLE